MIALLKDDIFVGAIVALIILTTLVALVNIALISMKNKYNLDLARIRAGQARYEYLYSIALLSKSKEDFLSTLDRLNQDYQLK